ncbi:Mitochondrial carrier protein ymc2 [Thecaphora frezii]
MLSQPTKDVLAGTTGGIAQVLVGQPLDILKVRLQTSPPATYTGMLDCAQRILRHEGPFAFYKGTLTPLLGVGACVSIQFGVVASAKRYFSQRNRASGRAATLSASQLYLAGGAAGLANSIIAGPVEHVRIRLQTQPSPPIYSGPVQVIRTSIANAGLWHGLYRGQYATFLREAHGMGMYFLAYEWLVQRYLHTYGLQRSQMPNAFAMFAGAMAGYALWLTAYPFDVVKSRMQTDGWRAQQRSYSSLRDCVAKIYAEAGIRGFFRGLLPTLVRSPFANAATFVAVEWAARNLDAF